MRTVSDNVVQEAVRSLAGNLVDEFLRQTLTAADLKSKVAEFASRLLATDPGKKIWSAIQAMGGYGEAIASHLRVGKRADPIVVQATDGLVEELKTSVSDLATYPESTLSNQIYLRDARSASHIGGNQVIDTLAKSAPQDDSVASKLLDVKGINSSSKSEEKSANLEALLSLARAQGLARTEVKLCKCVQEGVVLYSFYGTPQICPPGKRC